MIAKIPSREGNGVSSSYHSRSAPGTPSSHHGHNNNSTIATTISSKPTLITTPHLRFLIMDAPRQANLHLYIKECRRNFVTDIVRVCEPTYLGSELTSAGIELHEMAYEDGHSPPDPIIDKWLALVEERFFGPTDSSNNTSNTTNSKKEDKTIAVSSAMDFKVYASKAINDPMSKMMKPENPIKIDFRLIFVPHSSGLMK